MFNGQGCEEGNETVTNCHQLKMKAWDGKHFQSVTICNGLVTLFNQPPLCDLASLAQKLPEQSLFELKIES